LASHPYVPACIDSQAAEVVENSEPNTAVGACAELKEELSLVIKLVRLAMRVAVFDVKIAAGIGRYAGGQIEALVELAEPIAIAIENVDAMVVGVPYGDLCKPASARPRA
jgi:hypothetical protein